MEDFLDMLTCDLGETSPKPVAQIVAPLVEESADEDPFWGEPISIYTRAQAIEDGVLIDVSETAKEAAFRFPVAVTAGVWAKIYDIPKSQSFQNPKGRLWDVLSMARFAIRGQDDAKEILYKLIMHVGREKYITLKIVVGPGDNAEPVLTIMMPEED